MAREAMPRKSTALDYLNGRVEAAVLAVVSEWGEGGVTTWQLLPRLLPLFGWSMALVRGGLAQMRRRGLLKLAYTKGVEPRWTCGGEEVDLQPFVHRVVDAMEAEPLGKVGPSSVWDLGVGDG